MANAPLSEQDASQKQLICAQGQAKEQSPPADIRVDAAMV
jgi:hypothetical protein